jgi:hypothetical protein
MGTLDGANLIKLHRHSGKVSYLVYSDFETAPHPALRRSVKLSLRTREIDCFDFAASTNPPVLHRKETFLASDHPLRAKLARLTQQEEKHGLLDDSSAIGTREGWLSRLAERGFALKGHRLVKVNAQEAGKSPMGRRSDRKSGGKSPRLGDGAHSEPGGQRNRYGKAFASYSSCDGTPLDDLSIFKGGHYPEVKPRGSSFWSAFSSR